MSLQIVQVVACSIVAFLGGGAIAWRLLGRARGGRCPTLAREVTDRVHNRCAAYQALEERINNVIDDFDRREAELRAEWAGEAPPAYVEPVVSAAPAAFPLESTTGADALSVMLGPRSNTTMRFSWNDWPPTSTVPEAMYAARSEYSPASSRRAPTSSSQCT